MGAGEWSPVVMWDMQPCWRSAISMIGCNVIASSPQQQHFCAQMLAVQMTM